MKKITLAIIILLLAYSLAFAEWLVDFKENFLNDGIDKAVELAMKDNATPDMIVENGMQLEGLNPTNLIKALYCAGAQGQDIKSAAEKWQLSELIVAAGYKKSITECADVQAFSQANPVAGFVSVSPGGGGRTPVSPSGFPQ